MDAFHLSCACAVAFVVSIFSITVGGTSLVTVPVLIFLGMASRNAVATNMFALIFLSLSGAFGFWRKNSGLRPKAILPLVLLTAAGSLAGATLVLAIDNRVLRRIIAVMAVILAGVLFVRKDLGVEQRRQKIVAPAWAAAALLVFLLGIYGGFFSGGYVTLLSYVLVLLLGMDFLQAAFATKVLNVFSSGIACLFFFSHGLIDLSVGLPLALSMAAGAFLGARIAVSKGTRWVRALFIAVVLLLAIRIFF